MKNFVQPGENIDGLTAPRALNSGDGVLMGSLFGFALAAAAISTSFVLVTRGVFDAAKAAVAITPGQPAYWDDTAHVVTNTSNSGANKLIGVFIASAGSGAATGRLKIGYVAP